MTNIELDMEYISLYARQMNASATKAENDKVIFVDELLMYMALSYFLTVFSHAYDHREQNTKRCMNRLLDLLQIQGKERTIDVRNLQDVLEMITLPRNVLDLAMDCFWSARTFMVGHEIYHLITAQKTGDMPEEIRGFDENIYLSPIMLFEYFNLLDEYGALTGKAVILCGLGMVKFSFLLNFLLPKYLQNDDENKHFCCISFKM